MRRNAAISLPPKASAFRRAPPYLKRGGMLHLRTLGRCWPNRRTSTFDEPPQRVQSWIAPGGIARFTPARLCCSQILSLQDLFQIPFSWIKDLDTSASPSFSASWRIRRASRRGLRPVPSLYGVRTFLPPLFLPPRTAPTSVPELQPEPTATLCPNRTELFALASPLD